ncbi:MAG: class I SAM-dependent methyltransferase, partial [Planctomycetota bacterium]|nr:class I SAM-dependent methyltransferase [Planctomycetota bacterium]
DVIADCLRTGGFHGGQDGDSAEYDDAYAAYGFSVPARNPRYMSTSLYCCSTSQRNRETLRRWAASCVAAEFNGTGSLPGHGDQGILNAVLYAEGRTSDIHLLDNRLWSQHWAYWDCAIGHEVGRFVNLSAGRQVQRSFHCGGTDKFWLRPHRDRVLSTNSLQAYPFVWFLSMLWFGRCRDWSIDPHDYLPQGTEHLLEDLPAFLPQIMQIRSEARDLWDELTDVMVDRILRVKRFMSLGGGSMSDLVRLISDTPEVRRYVEVGCYEGGSILTLALRFLNRDIDFYAVESFTGNYDGTMDGWPLPSRRRFTEHLARFPTLRVTLVPGGSAAAASAFEDGSLDFVFIDACHETASVLRDIDVWLPKLKTDAILAGDDYQFGDVRRAVEDRCPTAETTPSGQIWWNWVGTRRNKRRRHGKRNHLILRCGLSPGDIVMLTAAVRDLHRAYPNQYVTDVRTPAAQLWENNPYITPLDESDSDVRVIDMHYPLIHRSNSAPYHFIHGYVQFLEEQLGLSIPVTEFRGDIHLTAEEDRWRSQVAETGYDGPFWVVIAGGKYDFTAKWWDPAAYQKIVDHFRGRIRFVQCGEAGHFHPKLDGVIDLVGKTDIRQFVRLIYHADGVLCPVTFAMHLAAAVPTKPGKPKNRACVVIAGGREPAQWEAYPHHRFLATNGALPCCADGGCWRSRCQPVGDGDPKDRDLCEYPIQITATLRIPKCLHMISPKDVADAIELYYEGGVLAYADCGTIRNPCARPRLDTIPEQQISNPGRNVVLSEPRYNS